VTADQVAGTLLTAGSAVFLLGAAVGVPRVFTERDPNVRLRMLEDRLGAWRAAQPLYVLGPIVASAGVGSLAVGRPAAGARAAFLVASLALLVGSLAWAWSVYLRATRVSEFAFGTLPRWPFTTYVLLTIGGLGLLGVGLLASGYPGWLDWLTLAVDILFLGIYLRFEDIPPFVFYLLLTLVGAVMLPLA
jgi:hypothetical protein